jgi:hypothetical protein
LRGANCSAMFVYSLEIIPHKSASSQNTTPARSLGITGTLRYFGKSISGSSRLHPLFINVQIPGGGMKVRKLIKPDLTRSVPGYVCSDCRYFNSASHISRWRPVTTQKQELGSRAWHRGAKRTTTLRVKSLPQGSLPVKPVEVIDEGEGPVYPTVLQQVRNNMQKFSHCVVLTRVGNFYEVGIRHMKPPQLR